MTMDIKMFGQQNLTANGPWSFSPFHSYNGMNSVGKRDTSYPLTESSDRSGWFNQQQKSLSTVSSGNNRPQFLRLDSTGERVPELLPSAAPSISVLPKPNMFNFHQQINRELGFGQRYTNTRCTKNSRRTPPRQTDIGQQGYPFHQFAMASNPIDKSVKFYGFRGDTQILNLAQLCPTNFNFNSYNRPFRNSPFTKRRMEDTNRTPQSGTNLTECDSLCDALGKMTVQQSLLSDTSAEVCPTSMNLSDQVNAMDSGYDETSLPSQEAESERIVQTDLTTHHPNESTELDQAGKQETRTEQVNAAAIPYECEDSPFLSTVILDYVESDTDSELGVSDTFSFFDSDDDSDIGDACSRSAEFDILSCFFPDDPFNPMNLNGTCNVEMTRYHSNNNNKRASETEDETETSRKRVRFVSDSHLEEVHEEESSMACDYQEARCGPWEDYARGRERFKRRITDLEPILSPCFSEEHRTKMWKAVHTS